jgi:hypothetical protein
LKATDFKDFRRFLFVRVILRLSVVPVLAAIPEYGSAAANRDDRSDSICVNLCNLCNLWLKISGR